MEKQERIDQLHEAQSLILEAVSLIKKAVRNSSVEERAKRYLISVLEIAATEEHDWLAENFGNIDALIRTLDEECDDDADEDEDDDLFWSPEEDENDRTEDEHDELPIVDPPDEEVIPPTPARSRNNPGDDPRLPPPVGNWLRSLHRGGIQVPPLDRDYDDPYYFF